MRESRHTFAVSLVRPLLLASVLAIAACGNQPERTTSAVVVNLTAPEGRFTNRVIVTVRSSDGSSGFKGVPLALLTCRVGDTVKVHERGVSLVLDEDACIR